MLKYIVLSAIMVSLMFSFAASAPMNTRTLTAAAPAPGAPQAASANLLTNANFDQAGFYWRPTNHFVAGMWYEWWIGGEMPEFIDGGSPYHNVCYPDPAGLCKDVNNHSQGYIRWGVPFVAGVYQPAPTTACATYRFEAYNRNDTADYLPQVGISPTGRRPTELHSGTVWNCPPDGNSECPNPSLPASDPFPAQAKMVWSPTFDHAAYTWAAGNVTAEAQSSTITVWTLAAPQTPGSMSAYWDNASLVQVPVTTLLPNGVIPAPDGKLTSLTVNPASTSSLIQWSTNPAAFSQVYYRVHVTPTVTDTSGLTNTVYLPIIGSGQYSVNNYPLKTAPTLTPSTNQAASLTGLQSNTAYDFVAVSRWFNGAACVPSVSAMGTFTTTP